MASLQKVGIITIGDSKRATEQKNLESAINTLRKLSSHLDLIFFPQIQGLFDYNSFDYVRERILKDELEYFIVLNSHGSSAPIIVELFKDYNLPFIVWSFPLFHSFPASASAVENLRERGKQVKLVCRMPEDLQVLEEIQSFLRLIFALRKLKNSRIGVIGGVYHFMSASHYHPDIISDRFGATIIQIPFIALKESFDRILPELVSQYLKNNLGEYCFLKIRNTRSLEKAIRLHLAIRELIKKYRLDAISLDCHGDISQIYGVNPCLGYWEDLIYGCEGEVVQILLALFVRGLNLSGFLGDPYSIDYLTNSLSFIHCAGPRNLHINKSEKCLIEEKPGYIFGIDYVCCRPSISPGKVTLLRLYGRNLDHLHMVCGQLIGNARYEKYLGVEIKLEKGGNDFVDSISGNHYFLAMGDIQKEVQEIGKFFRLNVLEKLVD